MPANRTILVADDEESYRTILGDELQRAGYKIVFAADGDEAIKILGREKIDLALLDIKMPKTDGLGVLRFIKKNTPATKVIVLTGFADLRIAMEAKENGAVDFVSKPFVIEDILVSIKQALP
jgi:DNA-binding NtrC family response regulator